MTAGPNPAVDLLLVSNGFGEAAIATYIARAIRARAPAARVEHLALVGAARAGAWPPAVGPHQDMPSGGLVAYWNLRNLARDLRAGLAGLTLRQYRYLARQTARDVIIAVGDVYCLAICLLSARRPTIFVATAKSDLVAPHSALERSIVRRATATFARDAVTAASLRAAGVRAEYAGNIMMDGVERSGIDLGVETGELVVAMLPGSRADATLAAAAQVDRLEALAGLLAPRGRRIYGLVSVAASVDMRAMRRSIEERGIALQAVAEGEGVIATGRRGNLRLALVRDAFGDLLAAADLALGQAGTANEQAAGLGLPVVAATLPGEAPEKMLWYRMRQKRLLGDALLVLPGEPRLFAADVLRLIDDQPRMNAMAAAGRERMGGAGGADAVAAKALSIAAASAAR